MDVFKPKVQVEAKVNTGSVVSLTAMMDCVPKCVYMCVCVFVLLWIEIAASAGRENDKVAVLLRVQQAAVGGGDRKWEEAERGVKGFSGRYVWEGDCEEIKRKSSGYTL